MYRAVYSKKFSEKLRERSSKVIQDVEKAVSRVLIDPNNHLYVRYYLNPFKQEHPTDKTITIFFEVNDAEKYVYFVWINDPSCPHDTLQSFGADPCVKEFLRLKGQPSGLEVYSKDKHEGTFKVAPRPPTLPRFLSFSKYDAQVHCNVLYDQATYYSLSIESDASHEDEIFDHYHKFLFEISKYFKSLNQPFEFRFVTTSYIDIIKIIQKIYDPAIWIEYVDYDETIFKLR